MEARLCQSPPSADSCSNLTANGCLPKAVLLRAPQDAIRRALDMQLQRPSQSSHATAFLLRDLPDCQLMSIHTPGQEVWSQIIGYFL